ncbi:MAG: hypothetical protein AMXMBFR82_30930 [Candidatus Hydrogenedentota bacterium]
MRFRSIAIAMGCLAMSCGIAFAAENAPGAHVLGEYTLWDPAVPLPGPEELAYPENVWDVVVHRADEEYRFLHDNALVWHGDTLFAAWYNCPEAEIQDSSSIRSRRSTDGGKTWSDVEVIAADETGQGIFYVPVTFLSRNDQLFAFVSNMVGHDLVTRCEVFGLDATADKWTSRGYVAGPFLPNCPPLLLNDGHYLMAGRMASQPATTPEIPAVAISSGLDVTAAWDVVPMMKSIARPHTNYPESTVWVDGPDVTAVVRGRLVFTSGDYGRTWTGPFRHNLPAEDSKPFALTLSTGQRCFLWNYPESPGSYRTMLTIAVSRPGEKALVSMWKIRHGESTALQARPEWSYPYAVEHDGAVYVIYTSEKRHSVLSVIPLESIGARR